MAGVFTDRRLNQDASAAAADATVSEAPTIYVFLSQRRCLVNGQPRDVLLAPSSPAKRSAAGNGTEPNHKHKKWPIPEVAFARPGYGGC